MTHFTDSHPTARTTHTCGMCGRTIHPGETYRRGAGMDGSSAWTWKECAHCEALVEYVYAALAWGDEYDSDLIGEWDPESWGHARLKAQWARKWTLPSGALCPVPMVERAEGKHGFGRVVGIRAGDPVAVPA